MSDKLNYAGAMRAFADTLATLRHQAEDFDKIYFDRGYNSGGADPIADEDVSGLGITAANVASGITLSQQLVNFFGNAAVTQGDYQSTINALRSTP